MTFEEGVNLATTTMNEAFIRGVESFRSGQGNPPSRGGRELSVWQLGRLCAQAAQNRIAEEVFRETE